MVYNSVLDFKILKILGLEVCADTLVGDEMLRGISGGQRKRLTTGKALNNIATLSLPSDFQRPHLS
jgi:ABC-type multidrug transport system ATPase subunit